MKLDSRIYVAGHKGLVGSAIVRNLKNKGYDNIITRDKAHLNLMNRDEVDCFFAETRPEYVFLAAAKVGGILANKQYKADFIYQNLMIQTNVIDSAYRHDVSKLLFLGSSCIYPKKAIIPIWEGELLNGFLEPTNDAYAIAKIAGIKMCQSYTEQYNFNTISLMPTNIYGPNDNFDETSSHVLPALINKFHKAKINNDPIVTCWGTGFPSREFLYVDDLAEACFFCMMCYNSSEIINVGTGKDIRISDLANLISDIVGYKGNIEWDTTKPDGTYRKVLDVTKLSKLGWTAKTSLEEGVKLTYDWYKESIITMRGSM